jgi:hypothetical protein
MDGKAIMTVSAATVALVQLAKWAGLSDSRGPLGVLMLSLLGVVFWGWSTGDVTRATAFNYFAGWIAVMTSAAGVFGFTRSTGENMVKFKGTGDGDAKLPSALVAIIALGLTLSACASVPAKARVSQTHQVAHESLVAVDEAERALCQPAPAAVNTCSNPVAVSLGLTNEKHQAFSRALAKAFDDDAKAGVAVIAWRAGDPVPADLTALLKDAQDIVSVAGTVTNTSVVGKAQTLLVRVQAAVAAFGGAK